MDVKQRMITFAKSKERSVRAFEKNVGFTIGYINAIRVSIHPDKLLKITEKYPDLNTEWLLTGKGEMLQKNSNEENHSEKKDETMPDKKIQNLQKTIEILLDKIRRLEEENKDLEKRLEKYEKAGA